MTVLVAVGARRLAHHAHGPLHSTPSSDSDQANIQQRHAHESPVIFYSLVIGLAGESCVREQERRGGDERREMGEEGVNAQARRSCSASHRSAGRWAGSLLSAFLLPSQVSTPLMWCEAVLSFVYEAARDPPTGGGVERRE